MEKTLESSNADAIINNDAWWQRSESKLVDSTRLRPVSNRRSKDVQFRGQNIGHQDSRDEVDKGARDNSKDTSTRASLFNTLMQRWKTVENKNRNAWEA